MLFAMRRTRRSSGSLKHYSKPLRSSQTEMIRERSGMTQCWTRFAQIADLRCYYASTTELRSLRPILFDKGSSFATWSLLVEDIEPTAVAPYIERSCPHSAPTLP